MKSIRKVIRVLTGAVGFMGAALVILLVLHVSADVILRNVFSYPIAGTIEVVSMVYMIGICFLPLALADERDAHISVEVLTELVPSGIVRWLIIAGTALGIIVMGFLCWRTWLEALVQYRKGAVMIVAGRDPIMTWPSYFLLPLGFGLSGLVCTWKLFCQLTRRPFGPGDEALPAGMELVARDNTKNV